MIGKKLTVKETNHKVKLLLVAGAIAIGVSLLFFLISSISKTGVDTEEIKKNKEKPKETEGNDIVLYDPNK